MSEGRRCRPRRGRKAVIILAVVGSFFAGGFLFSHLHASAEDAPGPGWMHHMPWMGPPGPHGQHPGGPPPPPMTPEQQAAHGREVLDHALTAVDATADQKVKVLTIYDTAINSLKTAPELVFQTRLQIATLLTAPTIDHDKIEQLRAARIADIDNASKVIVKAVSDAGDVLSQSQRTRLVMMLEHMRPGPPPHG
jgi:Spy/CpxP family protein refolding chaperone